MLQLSTPQVPQLPLWREQPKCGLVVTDPMIVEMTLLDELSADTMQLAP